MRIAWTGAIGEGSGVPGMGLLMVRELLRQDVEVDLYLGTINERPPAELLGTPGLRIIMRRSRWRWNRWYSRTHATAFFTSLIARSANGIVLSVRLLLEHRRRPYEAIFQLSQIELFLLGRLRRWAPPIVVHPCSHAAGELRWHRSEQRYALASERRGVHFCVRAFLTLRARIQRTELAKADLVIGPSVRFIELVHQDCGVPREKLRVLRHPVDLQRFAAEALQAKPLELLYISRISSRKGVEAIVGLSHRLADLAGSVRLVVIGGTTLWSDYSTHLTELNPETSEYLGGVAGDLIPDIMQNAAMLLVPSRYEPGSIVTGEALASGLPVVLSDEVGPSEVVIGPHVRVHRAGDLDDLEDSVRSLLKAIEADQPGLRRAARANAEAVFSSVEIVSQLIAILATAAAQPTSTTGGAPATDAIRSGQQPYASASQKIADQSQNRNLSRLWRCWRLTGRRTRP